MGQKIAEWADWGEHIPKYLTPGNKTVIITV